jgi:hypothetical protein
VVYIARRCRAVGNYVKLVVVGNRPYPVRIIYMHVDEKCTQPLRGTYFLNSPAGGPGGNLDFSFNLDSPVPTPQLQYVRGDYFKTHTVILRKGESATFEIGSWTARHYCSYTLQMSVVDDNKAVTDKDRLPWSPFSSYSSIHSLQDCLHWWKNSWADGSVCSPKSGKLPVLASSSACNCAVDL